MGNVNRVEAVDREGRIMVISSSDVLNWIRNSADVMAENREYLIELDSHIGDGDHGENMHRGFQAVLAKLPDVADKDIGSIFKTVGFVLVSTVGGASGPLYGTLFAQMGAASMDKKELKLADWAAAIDAGVKGVMVRGKAKPGDKTMVDALVPSLETLQEAVASAMSLEDALVASANAAEKGMRDTVPLIARKGRASYLGERSVGYQDPGATSTGLLMRVAAGTWAKDRDQSQPQGPEDERGN